MAGLAANIDPALERDADDRGRSAADAPACSPWRPPVAQGIWIQPDPQNRPNDLLDTDTNRTYRVVRYTGEAHIFDVRLLLRTASWTGP